MPNLYLHSGIVTRRIDTESRRTALTFATTEDSTLALFFAFLVNTS